MALLLTADINQYDISDPAHPRLTARLFTGGSIRAGSGVTVTDGEFKDAQPEVKPVKGVTLQGGPQMIQLRWESRWQGWGYTGPRLTVREHMGRGEPTEDDVWRRVHVFRR